MKELIEIQTRLRAPKNQYNAFGKYSYRSLEDVCEAVKPLLAELKCFLTFSDELVVVGTPFVVKESDDKGELEQVAGQYVFIKSTATIHNSSGESVSVSAVARHSDDKKGMDDSQISGATSSYSRKYAVNGLLCIDDNKDADVTNTHGKSAPAAAPAPQPRTAATRPAPAPTPAATQTATAATAPTPAATPAASPVDGMLKYMAGLGVQREEIEAAIGAPVENFSEEDLTLLRRAVPQLKAGMPFADAIVEAAN